LASVETTYRALYTVIHPVACDQVRGARGGRTGMPGLQNAIAVKAAMVYFLGAALHNVNAAVFDGSGIAVIEAPTGGVRLGQGIDLSSGSPTSAECVTGKIEGGPGNRPQTVTLKMRDNLDASSFFHEIATSAAAQASWITGNASAATEYVARHKFVSELATISVVETIEQKQSIVPRASSDISPSYSPS